jgi:hypothetical protein
MVAEELFTQLILLVPDLDGQEHTTGFLWLHTLCLDLKDWLRRWASRYSFHALPYKWVLLGSFAHEDLSRRDIANNINPSREIAFLSSRN